MRTTPAANCERIRPNFSICWRSGSRCFAFRRICTRCLLRSRGNDVLVVLGPFNEHMIVPEQRPKFRKLRDGIAAWLAENDVVCIVPETLPSDLYADDSHPLTDGYEQLAKAICIYSPWQFLYWYDRPIGSPGAKGGAGGAKRVIGDEPELALFDHVPTTWDETRVLQGEIGKFAVIARRSSSNWDIEMAPAEAQASSGRERWSLRFTDLGMTAEEGTDLYYYQQNYLAIVPMRVDEHDWELLENLGKSPPALPSWQPEDGR